MTSFKQSINFATKLDTTKCSSYKQGEMEFDHTGRSRMENRKAAFVLGAIWLIPLPIN